GGGTGTVSYDNTTKTATLKPSSELNGSTTYTATITTDVNDLSGNALSAAYLWVFTTIAGPDVQNP
ncbi:MAG TPA: Ig-like domain-containing protein, partial [Candidatus Brocadiaceae bacterium]|nr:Ig-like domain-containing protein [Candidatus Brocadiaceae bacterium]